MSGAPVSHRVPDPHDFRMPCCYHFIGNSFGGHMSLKLQINTQPAKVAEFCQHYRIRELSLFGSVLRADFRPDSDVDVLVDFEPDAQHSLFDLVRMEEELSALLGRKVDLIEKSGLRNPFRRHEILRTRQVIFAV